MSVLVVNCIERRERRVDVWIEGRRGSHMEMEGMWKREGYGEGREVEEG